MKKVTCRLRDDNTVLEIVVDISNPINQIYIDTYRFKDNYRSNIDSDHEFSFMTHDMLGNIEYTNTQIKYFIMASWLNVDKFSEMYIVTSIFGPNVNETQIVYNEQQLYCFRLKLMDNLCIPCSDKKHIDLLQVLMMRELMFREAVSLSRIDDAIRFYGKILTMKGVIPTIEQMGSANPTGCPTCSSK
jgi:hypothetical protein